MNTDVDSFLSHYGVKGMRWGVRKSIEAPAKTPMSKKKKALIAATVAVGVGVAATAAILYGPKVAEKFKVDKAANLLLKDFAENSAAESTIRNGENWTNGYLSKDVNLPSGTKFNRVASKLETEIGKNPKYATYLPKDVARYQSTFNSPFKSGNTPRFKTIIDSSAPVRIAGQESMMKTALSNASLSSKTSGRMRSEIIASYKGQANFEYMRDRVSKATNEEVAERWLNVQMGKSWKSPVSSAVLDSLKKAGYSGFTDNVDSFGGSQHAVVLISDSVLKLTGRPMSTLDVQAAQKLLDKLGG